MKTSELIEALQDSLESYGDLEVRLGADYGDYHHTLQALNVREVEPVSIYDSAYSRSGQAVVVADEDDDEPESDDDDSSNRVLLISSEWLSN